MLERTPPEPLRAATSRKRPAMARKPFVCGNWKMNGSEEETIALLDVLRPLLAPIAGAVEIAVAPPFPSLRTARERLAGTAVALAAQNLHWASHGAFTGEVSARM